MVQKIQGSEFLFLSGERITDLDDRGAEGWQVNSVAWDIESRPAMLLLTRPALTFQEVVTMDQRRRFFAQWGVADPGETDEESL